MSERAIYLALLRLLDATNFTRIYRAWEKNAKAKLRVGIVIYRDLISQSWYYFRQNYYDEKALVYIKL